MMWQNKNIETMARKYLELYIHTYLPINKYTYIRMYVRRYTYVVFQQRVCSFATYSTAQFKLDKAHVWHVLDTTRFSFCTRAGMRALARSMT